MRAPAVGIAVLLAGSTARAQVVYQADATVNAGVNQTTQSPFQADPNAEPGDVADTSSTDPFVEVRPGLAALWGSPRLTWRAGYQFAGTLGVDGGASYSNAADGQLLAQLTKFSSLAVSAALAQGGTSFLLSQRPAESGTPELRAPGNPSLIAATIGEQLVVDVGRRMQLRQGLVAAISAPQDDLGEGSSSTTASLALERVWPRMTLGLEARAGASALQPLRYEDPAFGVYTGALLARGNHDLSARWNASWAAGVEQVFVDAGAQPVAVLPTGGASVRYAMRDTVVSLDATHGTASNLQVGTVSVTDRLTARGVKLLDERKQRFASFSLGYLHNQALGEADAMVAAGTGHAIAADAGFTTAIRPTLIATARYSLAYQWGQDAGLEPTLAHIVLVGVTARWTNAITPPRRAPFRGQRVDGADGSEAAAFPTDGDLR